MRCGKCIGAGTLPATGKCEECQTGLSCANERLCEGCSTSIHECEICRESLPLPWPLDDVPADELEREAIVTEIDLLSRQPAPDENRIDALTRLLEQYVPPTPGT